MKSPSLRWIVATVALLSAALSLAHVLAQTRRGASARNAAEERPKTGESSPYVIQQNGQTLVRLSAVEQAHNGIETAKLQPAQERQEDVAPAVVLDVQNLVTLAANFDLAQANLRKAETTLSVSKSEYERLKTLYAKQQNISARQYQAMAGVFHNDQTDAQMARQNLDYQIAALRQSWGSAVADWVEQRSDSLHRVLSRQAVLVETTLPPGSRLAPPAAVSLELPAGGGRVWARYVSVFPQLDPRVQSIGSLYITHTVENLAPGLNVAAHFGVGVLRKGVIVPASAVVWWHGRAWAYVLTPAGDFVQREVATGAPVRAGWFASRGFAPGELVVTRGAEQLLSIQISPAPSAASGEGEGDTD